MRLGLFLTTLIGLAGASHISSAADATWAAVGALENGTVDLHAAAAQSPCRTCEPRSGRLTGRST